MTNDIYDIVGVGIGPFNLSLACMTAPLNNVKTLFFDSKPQFDWHSGIMPEWTTLQIPFFADLVTFADPTSPFSFLNFLKSQGRIYQYYIRESFFILRSEYNEYCQWAAAQLNSLRFGHQVTDIVYDSSSKIYTVTTQQSDNRVSQVRTRHIVLGTGTSPVIPEFCQPFKQQLHLSADYLKHKQDYQHKKSITIVGSGQSGAEIFYDLLNDIDVHHYQLNWITRSDRFFAMDLNKLTLELTSPDYTDHFYHLPAEQRDDVINKQAVLYKGINTQLLDDIYDLLYIKTRKPNVATRLVAGTQVNHLHHDGDVFTLDCTKQDASKNFTLTSEAVILALGYEYQQPDFLSSIAEYLCWDEQKRLMLTRNYAISHDHNVFVQNVGLYSHGISTPDLGMGCYRNAIIINQILNEEVYPVEKRICFQEFLPDSDTDTSPYASH